MPSNFANGTLSSARVTRASCSEVSIINLFPQKAQTSQKKKSTQSLDFV
jgi:hypothetical protein